MGASNPFRTVGNTIVAILLAIGIATTTTSVSHAHRPSTPELGLVAPEPNIPGSIEVQGDGFTPGGDVWVTIVDNNPGNHQVARTLQSATATSDGTIDVVFPPDSLAYTCEDSDIVRAFDASTGRWTDPIALGCALLDLPGHPLRITPD